MPKNSKIDVLERKKLKYQYEVLRRAKEADGTKQHWKNFLEVELDTSKTIYEKYRHMYDKNRRTKRFDDDETFEKDREEEEDPFFLDPQKEDDSKKLEQSKQELQQKLKTEHLEGHNQSGFLPYEDLSFIGTGGIYQTFSKNKNEKKFGREVCTPMLSEQIKLDPKHWKENVNFLPIPPKQNKFMKLKGRKLEST